MCEYHDRTGWTRLAGDVSLSHIDNATQGNKGLSNLIVGDRTKAPKDPRRKSRTDRIGHEFPFVKQLPLARDHAEQAGYR